MNCKECKFSKNIQGVRYCIRLPINSGIHPCNYIRDFYIGECPGFKERKGIINYIKNLIKSI